MTKITDDEVYQTLTRVSWKTTWELRTELRESKGIDTSYFGSHDTFKILSGLVMDLSPGQTYGPLNRLRKQGLVERRVRELTEEQIANGKSNQCYEYRKSSGGKRVPEPQEQAFLAIPGMVCPA